MKKLDHHEEAISGRKYQDPADLHHAVYNTNGYMHEDDPDGDGIGVFGAAILGALFGLALVGAVFVVVNIAQ